MNENCQDIQKIVLDTLEKITGCCMECTQLEDDFVKEIGIDSFDLMLLFGELEEKLGLDFSYEEIENICSAADLVKYIELKKVRI